MLGHCAGARRRALRPPFAFVDEQAAPGLLLRAPHVAGHFVVHTELQWAACTAPLDGADAAAIERSLRGTRGLGDTAVEDPAALLDRLFEFGGRIMFY